MNEILENLYPDKDVVARRRSRPFPQLLPRMDLFSGYVHEEMRQCYLNGHDHAALVTACALIESTIKDAIHHDAFVKADCVFNADEWDKIDGMTFAKAVNMAKSHRIVTKDEWEKLEWFRKHIRNVYMHGQTADWIKDKDDTVFKGDLQTGEVDRVQVSVREDIVLQRLIRIGADRNVCDMVVALVDGFVRVLTMRSIKALEEWKKENASKPTREQVERALENMQKKGLEAGFIITADYADDVPVAPEEPNVNDG